MIDHLALKTIHVSCALLSVTGFMLRGGLMLAGSDLLSRRLTRTLPHVVDSLLFVSGLWLAFNIQQYPGGTPWLTAKLAALLVYIILGAYALRGRTRTIRRTALAGALAAITYLVAVALTRSPLPLAPVG